MISAYRQQEASLSGPQGSSNNPQSPYLASKATPFFNRWRLGYIGVLIVSILVYLPSLAGQKIWDDDLLLDGSGIGGGASALSSLTHPFMGAYFRPLVSISFYFENRLWHGVPFYYHQTNILLHMLTCAALIGLVLTAFGSRRLALLSGLIFAVQPVQVSTVAWIGGRTDSLCALLVVLFAYALVLGVRANGLRRVAWISVSTAAFFLAAVTKEQILALLPLVPYALKAFGSEDPRRDFKAYVRLSVPYVLASVVFVVLWLSYNPTPFKALFHSPAHQLTIAGHTVVYYTLLFLLPSGKWMHTLSLGTFQAVGWPSMVAGLVLLSAWLGGTGMLIRRNPKFGWIALLSTLAILPVSNLIPLPSLLVAPYRAGVAGVGVAVLLAWLGLRMERSVALTAIFCVFLGWCTWLTAWGSAQWKDPVTLFAKVTAEDPYSIVARRNMGSYLLKIGKAEESIEQMKSILTMLYETSDWQDPKIAYSRAQSDQVLRARVEENQGNEVKPGAWLGELFSQLGFAEARTHDFVNSRKAFEAAVHIDPSNPRARVGMAQYALYDGNLHLALRNLRIAVAAAPKNPQLYILLGSVYSQTGKLDLAEEAYKKAIEIEPLFGPTYQDLAEVQVKKKDLQGAIKTLQSAQKCTVLDINGIQNRINQLEQAANKGTTHAS